MKLDRTNYCLNMVDGLGPWLWKLPESDMLVWARFGIRCNGPHPELNHFTGRIIEGMAGEDRYNLLGHGRVLGSIDIEPFQFLHCRNLIVTDMKYKVLESRPVLIVENLMAIPAS